MEQIKIIKPIYIRKGAGRSHDSLAVVYPSGKDLVMDGMEKGENLKGIDDWYYKINDKGQKQYYWRGGTRAANYNASWGIKSLGIDRVWKETYGENNNVAILDTGIDLNNEDLGSAVIKGFNILTNEDFSFNRDCIQDTDGHGTACATIIASRGTLGAPGIAPACNLIIIKVADNKNQLNLKRALVKGIEKAVEFGAQIISISAGFTNDSTSDDEAIASTIKKYWHKHLFVAASGNKSSYVAYPANILGMISVGALTVDNTELGYKEGNFEIGLISSQGQKDDSNEGITIVAPGDKIPVYNLNKTIKLFRGTSAAAPFVAGVITLLLAYSRKIQASVPENQSNIRKMIIESAFNVSENADEEIWGNGIIDPVRLILK